jgi:NAD(P)-dependent dehydrogenase (short-subunit alcohol dehydrogenase family)
MVFKSKNAIVGAMGVGGAPGGDKDEVCARAGVARVADRCPIEYHRSQESVVRIDERASFQRLRRVCMSVEKTAIITGAAGGIGAGLVEAFLEEGYRVVATSLNASQALTASPNLVLVDGDIGRQETAVKVVEAAIRHFGTIEVLVNNAGIIRTKPFTDFTTEDFDALVSTNLRGFLYMTQLTVKQMLKQKSGSIVSITAALADQPIAGINASVSMITKGGLNTVTRSLAIEYAKEGIRFNAVAPGVVDTPLHKDVRQEPLTTRQPMGKIAEVKDIVDAVLYLVRAGQVTGEVLHVDGGAHAGRW